MGNHLTRHSSVVTGKVILSDGTIQEFDEPLTVAELMLEHPQQVVVEFCSDLSENRPTPLPADKMLDAKKVYLMLPMKRGKPASLSSEEARHVLLSANSVFIRSRPLLSSAGSWLLPLFAKICSVGVDDEGVEPHAQKLALPDRENNIVERPLEKAAESLEFFPEDLESRPYLSKQLSGKGWRPSLDTIKEKQVEKKVPHWLF